MTDYATAERQAFIAKAQTEADAEIARTFKMREARKLKRAKRILGSKHCLAKHCTLTYRAPELTVPNLVGRRASALR